MLADGRLLRIVAIPRVPRARAASAMRRLSRVLFAVAVVLSPVRGEVVLASQPLPPLYAGYTDFALSWAEIAILATLAAWVLAVALAPPDPDQLPLRQRALDVGPRLIVWPLAVLIGLAWASALTSLNPVISLQNAAIVSLLAAFAVYVRAEISLGQLIAPLVAMVALQAVVALAQVLGQGSVGLAGLGELQLSPAVNGVSVVATSTTDRLLRAYGLTDHPNILGGVLAFSLPLLALGVARARRPWTWIVVLVLAIGALALLGTFSRAAWLAVVVALVVALVMLRRGREWEAARRVALGAAALGVLCLALAIPYARFIGVRTDVGGTQVATEAMSIGERAILVDATTRIAIAHPLLGTGLATLPIAIHATEPGLTFVAQPAPIVVLDVAAELGLGGALCYAVVLVAPWLTLWRLRARWTPEVIALSAALAATTVVGLFDYYTWTFSAGRIWLWLLLGLWAGGVARATKAAPAAVSATGAAGESPDA